MNDMGDMNNSISPNGDSAVLLLAGFERYIRVFGAVEIKSSEDKVWKRLKTSGGCGVSCRRILMPALITRIPSRAGWGRRVRVPQRTVAAVVEALLGNPFGVAHALLIGMAQSVGAEIGFAAFRYRRWDVVSTALAGALTGLCNGGYDWLTKAGWTMTQGSRVHHLLCHLRGRVRRRADAVRAEGPCRDRRAGPLRIRTERQNGMLDSCARYAAHRSPILAYSCHHSIK